jgi:hypothetical protein
MQILRKDLEAHNFDNMHDHLALVLKELSKVEQENIVLQKEKEQLTKRVDELTYENQNLVMG